jgi:hypothetical protein
MFDECAIHPHPHPHQPETTHDLRLWMNAWYDRALADGFIYAPFELDDATARRLYGYFDAGLTPLEGVCALFGTVH